MSTPSATAERPQPWYQGLDRYCWIVLTIAALGWLFDTMDQNLFNLIRTPSLRDLIQHSTGLTGDLLTADVKEKAGWVTSIFLIGWSVGGFLFGMLGDRLGRTRTMMLTILIYAVFTGMSGAPFVKTWETYALMRFLTAVGVGGEWAAGAALVAEVFPNRSRAMALGLLQALSAVGNMTAALITLGMANAFGSLDTRWRWVYFIGAVPALLVFWIQRSVKEPEQWHQAKTLGQELGSIGELFTHPVLRRNLIAGMMMATAGVGAIWGVGFFSTDFVRNELTSGGVPKAVIDSQVSGMFFLQNLGAFFGAYLFAMHCERTNRKTAFVAWYAIAWLTVLAFFWTVGGKGAGAFKWAMLLAPLMGAGTLGPLSGFTIYFPELFPTRLRTTGCGFCYNAARILAAFAPYALGGLTVYFKGHGFELGGGYVMAASVVSCVYLLGFLGTAMGPETKGKPLPA